MDQNGGWYNSGGGQNFGAGAQTFAPAQSQFGNVQPAQNFAQSPFGSHSAAPVNSPFPVQAPIGNNGGVMPPNLSGHMGGQYNDNDDPPLLEELGIDPHAIIERMKGIAFFKKLSHDVAHAPDMWGPILIIICLAGCFTLGGKLLLGPIYGMCVTGFGGLYLLINAMANEGTISLAHAVSILGYGLMPVVGLAVIAILMPLKNTLGTVISLVVIVWCTATTSRFFEASASMHEQRWLVAYPISLVYSCFVILTVF